MEKLKFQVQIGYNPPGCMVKSQALHPGREAGVLPYKIYSAIFGNFKKNPCKKVLESSFVDVTHINS